MSNETDNEDTPPTWEQEHSKLKTMWVVSVLAFWFSVLLQGGILFLTGKVNLILMSVILGVMILGVALKIRLQRHMKTKPDE